MAETRIRRSTVIAAGAPVLLLASFYLFIGFVGLWMGGWPDPDALPPLLKAWEIVAAAPVVLLYPAVPVAVVIVSLSLVPRFRCLRTSSVAFLVSSILVLVFAWAFDPGGFWVWVMD